MTCCQSTTRRNNYQSVHISQSQYQTDYQYDPFIVVAIYELTNESLLSDEVARRRPNTEEHQRCARGSRVMPVTAAVKRRRASQLERPPPSTTVWHY